MRLKKDRFNLHCSIRHNTAAFLKEQSVEQGITVGEMIDFVVQMYLRQCERQDAEIQAINSDEKISDIIERLEIIEQQLNIRQMPNEIVTDAQLEHARLTLEVMANSPKRHLSAEQMRSQVQRNHEAVMRAKEEGK